MPASGLNGASNGVMTSLFQHGASCDVLPDRARRSRSARPCAAARARRARAAPPAGRRRSRNPPSGSGPTASGRPGNGRRGRAGRNRRASGRRRCARRSPAGGSRHWSSRRSPPACGSRSRTPRGSGSSDSTRSSPTISTMRRPAMRASRLRRASTAGIAALLRQADAERLDHRGHGRGGAHGHAVPAERFIAASASWNSSSVISPARSCSLIEMMLVPEPIDLAAVDAAQLRSARDADGRQVGATPRPSAAPAWSCRSPSAARRRRADGRGSPPRRPSRRDCGTASRSAASSPRRARTPETRAENRRPRARRARTCSAMVRKCALQGVSSDQVLQMPITGRPSNWSCGDAAVLQERAVVEAHLVLPAEPGLAATCWFGEHLEISGDDQASMPLRRSSSTIRPLWSRSPTLASRPRNRSAVSAV